MNISEETVRHVAKLARLAVTDEDAHKLAPQLSDIISYAEQLQKLDLENVPPTSHSTDITNVLRRDIPRPSLSRDTLLSMAPDTDGQHVRVPAVLEG